MNYISATLTLSYIKKKKLNQGNSKHEKTLIYFICNENKEIEFYKLTKKGKNYTYVLYNQRLCTFDSRLKCPILNISLFIVSPINEDNFLFLIIFYLQLMLGTSLKT